MAAMPQSCATAIDDACGTIDQIAPCATGLAAQRFKASPFRGDRAARAPVSSRHSAPDRATSPQMTVEHRPRSLTKQPVVLMFEPATTLNTGHAVSSLTVNELKRLKPAMQ